MKFVMTKELYMTKFSTQYFRILHNVTNNGVKDLNTRTNNYVYTHECPVFINLDLSDGLVPMPGNRTVWPRVAASEVAWQFQGTKDPELIMKHAPKIWGDFIEDGELKAAYGHRWYNQFGRNQIHLAIDALKKDKTNRQIYVSTWDPSADGLGQPNQPKNIPCIVGFTLNVIDNKLNMAVNMRSSDVYVGLPYDIMTYALMLDALAASIGVERGYMSFMLANAHLYQSHLDDAINDVNAAYEKSLHEAYEDSTIGALMVVANNVQEVKMPGMTVEEIEQDPEAYIQYFKNIKIKNFNHTKPKVVV